MTMNRPYVPNQFRTSSEFHRQMEDGGGRGRRKDGESSLTVVTPSSVREGTTTTSGADVQLLAQLEAECRTLVGAHPVATNVNFGPIAALVGQGASHSDIIGGIRAAMAKTDFRPRSWAAFENFIRRERTLAQARDLVPSIKSIARHGMRRRCC